MTKIYHCSKCGKEETKKTVYFNSDFDVECVKGCKPVDVKRYEEKKKQEIANNCISNNVSAIYRKAKSLFKCNGFDILASERVLYELNGIRSTVFFIQGESELYTYINLVTDKIIKRDFALYL